MPTNDFNEMTVDDLVAVVDKARRERDAMSPLEREIQSFVEWSDGARANGVPAEEISSRWAAHERVMEVDQAIGRAWDGLADGVLGALCGEPMNLERREKAIEAAEAEIRSAIDEAMSVLGAGEPSSPSDEAMDGFLSRMSWLDREDWQEELRGMDEAFKLRLRAYMTRKKEMD
ncbi:MAG: hypothetical protein ACRDLL_16780 [Solirubrobacterales bacterium]